MEFMFLNSSDLQVHLVMLLTSTLARNCNFLNKVIDIINFAKCFINFIADTIILYLNSILDLNLSCNRDLRNQSFMAT